MRDITARIERDIAVCIQIRRECEVFQHSARQHREEVAVARKLLDDGRAALQLAQERLGMTHAS